tara:strand:- start:5757 stop:6317 length:561 start_codon:yes stop_codon:yes gene_type:complete
MSDQSQISSVKQETPANASFSPVRILVPLLVILIGLLLFWNLRTTEYDEFVGQLFNYEGVSYTGEVINQENLQGSVVVINFWATYCPYCLEDIVDLKDLQQELRHDDFRIIGVSSDTREKLDEFFQSRDLLPWPSFCGADAVSLGQMYKVSTIPRVMLLDREGVIVAVARGIDDIKGQVLRLVHDG